MFDAPEGREYEALLQDEELKAALRTGPEAKAKMLLGSARHWFSPKRYKDRWLEASRWEI